MAKPVITLLTDFGLADHYVGVMKGVIYGICPNAVIVDLSHEVPPFEIVEAAFLLSQAWRHFPHGTVHMAVVDPGVGSARRPILVETGGHTFVGPDNGIFSMLYAEEVHKVRQVTAEQYFLQPMSQSFHGRDVFAPVAARLAAGVTATRMGSIIKDFTRLNLAKPIRTARRGWTGAILRIDRFGNVVTNFGIEEFSRIREQAFEIKVGLQAVEKISASYAEARFGELFLIAGSSGYFEVSTNQGNAAKILGVGAGAPVELRLL